MDLEQVLSKLENIATQVAQLAGRMDGENGLVKVGEKVGTIDTTVRDLQSQIDEMKKKVRGQAKNILPGFEAEIEANGGISPIEAMYNPNSRDAAFVREYMKKAEEVRGPRTRTAPEGEARDITTVDDGKGGIFIPNQALPGWVDKIRERTLLWRPDAGGPKLTRWNNLTGQTVELNVILDDVSVEQSTEIVAPTASDPGFGQMKFEARTIKSLTKFSKRQLRMGPLVEQAVRLSAEKMFAKQIDQQGFRGKGTDKESLGIVNTPGILSLAIGTNGGNFQLPTARAMRHKLRQNSIYPGSAAGFVGHPDTFYTAQIERIAQYSGDTGGQYVILPMTEDQLRSLIGPFWDSTLFPTNLTKGSSSDCTEIVYGNWEDLHMGIWEDLSFSVSDQQQFSESLVLLKAEMEIDFLCVRPQSFVLVNDARSVTL